MLLANENTYRNLSTFECVEELNAAIKGHRSAHNLSETELTVLDVISRYSCKYPGVSYLTKTNIAKQIGKVRRTVIRVCLRLEALGIIKQYETKRDGGDRRQSSNVIVILPAEEMRTSANMTESKRGTYHDYQTQVTPSMSRQKALIPSKQIHTYKDTAATALQASIPAPIYSALAPYYNADELYDTYGLLLRAKASVDRNITVETYGESFVQAFKAVIYRYKRGKVGKLSSYLYTAWRKVATEIKQAEVMRSHDVLGYDWLGD